MLDSTTDHAAATTGTGATAATAASPQAGIAAAARRPIQAGRTVHAFGHAFAGVGSILGIGLAVLLPALLFRADAPRDTRLLVGLAFAASWLSGFVGAAWVQAFPDRRARARAWHWRVRAWRVRRAWARTRLVALLLAPFVTYAAAAHARLWLIEHEDPLFGYCERGLSRALAQPGLATPTQLDVVEGRLMLSIPAYPARRARWWVDVDADDTAGRRCTFHAPVLFGDDPAVLRIPLPMASNEMPERPYGLVPGSMVVVHGVMLTLDSTWAAGVAPSARAAAGPQHFVRKMALVYEVPVPRRSTRSPADFVSREGGASGR